MTNTQNPRRRGFMLALAGAAVLPAAAMAMPVNPDATLIALCRDFLRLDAADKAKWDEIAADGTNEAEEAYEPLFGQRMKTLHERFALICDTRAITADGRRLKAMVALSQANRDAKGEIIPDPQHDWGDLMAWALVNDIAADRAGRVA